jgi:hypothetical protein
MNCELIYASDFEEFFYCENDLPVSEGNPVGVEIDRGHEIEFILFGDVYWSLSDEEES